MRVERAAGNVDPRQPPDPSDTAPTLHNVPFAHYFAHRGVDLDTVPGLVSGETRARSTCIARAGALFCLDEPK